MSKQGSKTTDIQRIRDEMLDGVICGDVLDVMPKLIKKGEKFDCIFADPDYNVGVKYGTSKYSKEYKEYIKWCRNWSELAHKLLDDRGSFFIINYPKNNSYLRVDYLDEAFYDVTEYVWVYNVNIGQSSKKLTTAHRTILHCRKSKDNKFYKDNIAEPYQNPTDKRIKANIKNGSKGRMPYSWLNYNLVKNVSKDKTFHPCQIPQKLSKLFIKACTQPKDKVLILFAGSGNDVMSALETRRKATAIDIDEKYCNLIKERIRNMDSSLIDFVNEEKSIKTKKKSFKA